MMTSPHFGGAGTLLCAALVLLPAQVSAASEAHCNLTVTAMNFGEYSSRDTRPVDFTAAIVVNCTAIGDTPIPVNASITVLSNDGAAPHFLQSGSQKLRYQIYVDAARTVPWSSNPEHPSLSGLVSADAPLRRNLTMYGRIPARQSTPEVGFYEDMITIVLNY